MLYTSPSSRGRGLKFCEYAYSRSRRRNVALFTRAWIEIARYLTKKASARVALFTRAWIEISFFWALLAWTCVALFTRAWIEMIDYEIIRLNEKSRPLHEGVD